MLLFVVFYCCCSCCALSFKAHTSNISWKNIADVVGHFRLSAWWIGLKAKTSKAWGIFSFELFPPPGHHFSLTVKRTSDLSRGQLPSSFSYHTGSLCHPWSNASFWVWSIREWARASTALSLQEWTVYLTNLTEHLGPLVLCLWPGISVVTCEERLVVLAPEQWHAVNSNDPVGSPDLLVLWNPLKIYHLNCSDVS